MRLNFKAFWRMQWGIQAKTICASLHCCFLLKTEMYTGSQVIAECGLRGARLSLSYWGGREEEVDGCKHAPIRGRPPSPQSSVRLYSAERHGAVYVMFHILSIACPFAGGLVGCKRRSTNTLINFEFQCGRNALRCLRHHYFFCNSVHYR